MLERLPLNFARHVVILEGMLSFLKKFASRLLCRHLTIASPFYTFRPHHSIHFRGIHFIVIYQTSKIHYITSAFAVIFFFFTVNAYLAQRVIAWIFGTTLFV